METALNRDGLFGFCRAAALTVVLQEARNAADGFAQATPNVVTTDALFWVMMALAAGAT